MDIRRQMESRERVRPYDSAIARDEATNRGGLQRAGHGKGKAAIKNA